MGLAETDTPTLTTSTGPSTLLVCSLPLALLVHASLFHPGAFRARPWTIAFPAALTAACLAWSRVVSREVPEPYLVRPASHQALESRLTVLDRMRCSTSRRLRNTVRASFASGTTRSRPPQDCECVRRRVHVTHADRICIRYLFSVFLPQLCGKLGIDWQFRCDATSLRAGNVVSLFALAYLALLCREEIEAQLYGTRLRSPSRPFSTYALHTAFNIALFPLLFFFSGLYYTDVLSTAVVVGAFLNHLKRVARDRSSVASDLFTIAIGLLALLMRQTNVFWIVVFMGGLEAVHAVKTLRPERVDQPFMTTLWAQLKYFAWRYSVGDIHDLPLSHAWHDGESLVVGAVAVPHTVQICSTRQSVSSLRPSVTRCALCGKYGRT